MLRGGLERGEGFPRSRQRVRALASEVLIDFAIGVAIGLVFLIATWFV